MTDSRCLCSPGSEENHWFEERDPKCVRAEMQQWKEAMESLPRILDMLTEARQNRDIQTKEVRQDN